MHISGVDDYNEMHFISRMGSRPSIKGTASLAKNRKITNCPPLMSNALSEVKVRTRSPLCNRPQQVFKGLPTTYGGHYIYAIATSSGRLTGEGLVNKCQRILGVNTYGQSSIAGTASHCELQAAASGLARAPGYASTGHARSRDWCFDAGARKLSSVASLLAVFVGTNGTV